MPWIGAEQRSHTGTTPDSSLEYPTQAIARGLSPATAIVEHLTVTECRLRTTAFYDPGDFLEFDFTAPKHATIRARGHAISRVASGPRFTYRIRLDRMTAKEADELARAVAETYRRQARSRLHERALKKLPTTEGLVRESVRVVSRFPIFYRTARANFAPAKAQDVSSGGLSMTCNQSLANGETIELRLTLPCDPLSVYPEQTAILDLRSRTVTHARANLRRAFEEMLLRARVVTQVTRERGVYVHGLSLVDIGSHDRDELARYVHAVQLARKSLGR